MARILLIDDEDMIRALASEMLQLFGHEVTDYGEVDLFLDFYRNNYKSIDIVIFDLMMPKMHGSLLFDEMIEINPEIKSLVMTGMHEESDEMEQLVLAGVKGIIEKPFTIFTLKDEIESLEHL